MYSLEKISRHTNPIIIFINNETKPLKNNDGILKFSSFSSAKKYLYLNGYNNPNKYKLSVVVNNKTIDYSDIMQLDNNLYEYYDESKGFVRLYEMDTEIITSINYICFENGDEVRINKEIDGVQKSKELMKICTNTLGLMRKENDMVKKFYFNKYTRNINVELLHCQESIYLCHNNQLIRMNMNRKDLSIKSLPFIKEVDRFLTIYMYSTMEYVPGVNFNENYKIFLDHFLSRLKDIKEDTKYKEIDVISKIYI